VLARFDPDRRLFAAGSVRRGAAVRIGLAIGLGLRLATRPHARLADVPDVLFQPPPFLWFLDGMPPRTVLIALQLVGATAAVLVVVGRRSQVSFAVAWICLLGVAGLRDSLGKVMHNDVLLLLACVPFLLMPATSRVSSPGHDRRHGWPVRTSMLLICGGYFMAGYAKIVHTGIEWVIGDNMRWVLFSAAAGDRPPTAAVALAIAERPWLAHLTAASILGFELLSPLALVLRRLRPPFILGAMALHFGTWLTLGLDYWGWALTVAAVFLDWDRILGYADARRGRAKPATGQALAHTP